MDKFHVLRTATSALEGTRKRVRKGLNSRQRVQLKNDRFLLLKSAKKLKPNERLIIEAWGGASPDLVKAWELKEAYYAIYEADDPQGAAERMDAWLPTVPKHMQGKKEFGPAMRAFRKWRDEILAYWKYPVTNAYTESLNNLIRGIERAGRGYTLDVLRAKILHGAAPLNDDVPPIWTDHLPEGWIAVKHPYVGWTAKMAEIPDKDWDFYALWA